MVGAKLPVLLDREADPWKVGDLFQGSAMWFRIQGYRLWPQGAAAKNISFHEAALRVFMLDKCLASKN